MKYTLEQARTLAGFTQLQMAKKLNMSEKTYIRYEKYRIYFRMDTAHLFATLVGIDIGSIIFFDQEVQKICS